MRWPGNAAEVRTFLSGHVALERYARDDHEPDDNDHYTLSAHDLLEAIAWWTDCEPEDPAAALAAKDQEIQQLRAERAELQRRIAELEQKSPASPDYSAHRAFDGVKTKRTGPRQMNSAWYEAMAELAAIYGEMCAINETPRKEQTPEQLDRLTQLRRECVVLHHKRIILSL